MCKRLARLAATLLITATMPIAALAEGPPEWWPAEMTLPDDSRIEDVREVGSRIRMLAFHTGQDAETLLTRWAETMETARYVIDWSVNPEGPPSFEFEGEKVLNGQVVSMPCPDACASRIEVDMTLR